MRELTSQKGNERAFVHTKRYTDGAEVSTSFVDLQTFMCFSYYW
jgi:hypothetical protein